MPFFFLYAFISKVAFYTSFLIKWYSKKLIKSFCTTSYFKSAPRRQTWADFLFINNSVGNALFRKQCWFDANGFDENMKNGFEDWEFYIRLLANGGAAYVIPKVYLHYRIKPNSTTSRANKVKRELLEYIYFKNKNIFIEHYESLVSYFLSKIENEEKEKLKNYNKIEFKIGKVILKPFRFIKSFFK